MLLEIADRLQDSALINWLTSTGWMAALIAILHYYSMFVLVGSMAIVDLGVLGVIGHSDTAVSRARRTFPWVWAALTVNIITGFIMFAGDATAYVPTISFNVKILIVLTAIALTIGVRFKLPTSDETAAMPSAARLLALISLIFWVVAILMGVEVPALSGVG